MKFVSRLLALTLIVTCTVSAGFGNTSRSSSSRSAKANKDSLVGTTWLLTDLAGTPAIDHSKASLSFAVKNAVSGNASCNHFTGKVTISVHSIKFSPLATTQMACPDETVGAQELLYLKLLATAMRVQRNGDSLLIYAKQVEKPLRFSLVAAAR